MSRHNDTSSPPFAPRDWLSAVRDILGDAFVLNLFRVDIRSYQRWTAKRPHVCEESIRENYLEKHDAVLNRLMRDGYDDIAQAIVSHHAHLVGCNLTPVQPITPDRDNVEDEMLDDYPALTEFHRAIRERADIDTLITLKNKVVDELNQTLNLTTKGGISR